MALGAGRIPDSLDFACGIDQETAANNAEKGFAEKFLHAARAVGFDRLQIGIAEQIEVEFLFGFEIGLGFNRVAAQAEDHRVQLVEVLLGVAKLGRFGGSTRRVGFGVEEKDHVLAAKVGERDIGAGVVL